MVYFLVVLREDTGEVGDVLIYCIWEMRKNSISATREAVDITLADSYFYTITCNLTCHVHGSSHRNLPNRA